MNKSYCDVCGNVMEQPTEHLGILSHGAQILEIRTGINKLYEGDQCLDCTKKLLSLVIEKGIFVGRKITLPEQEKPVLEAIEQKHSYRLLSK